MDVSDGLAGDLAKMMRASGVSRDRGPRENPALACGAKARHRRSVAARPAGDRRRRLRDSLHRGSRPPLDSFRKEADRVGVPLAAIGQVVPGGALPTFRLAASGKALRCRFIHAFLKARRRPQATASPNATPSCWPIAQALGGANPAIVVVARRLGRPDARADNKQFATVPVSLSHLGLALGTHSGRDADAADGAADGYIVGGCVGVLAGCMAAFGIASTSFLIFCFGDLRGRVLLVLRPELPLRRHRHGLGRLPAPRHRLGHERRHRGRNRRAPDGDLDTGHDRRPAICRRVHRAGRAGADRDRGRIVPARAAGRRHSQSWAAGALYGRSSRSRASSSRWSSGLVSYGADELPDDGRAARDDRLRPAGRQPRRSGSSGTSSPCSPRASLPGG